VRYDNVVTMNKLFINEQSEEMGHSEINLIPVEVLIRLSIIICEHRQLVREAVRNVSLLLKRLR
jgi:hypothetical protein